MFTLGSVKPWKRVPASCMDSRHSTEPDRAVMRTSTRAKRASLNSFAIWGLTGLATTAASRRCSRKAARSCRQSSHGELPAPSTSSHEPINILVVGECGDGKSTLINGLRDRSKSEAARCGKNPQGVTKDIVVYPCEDIDGVEFNILDTPGVGDHEVSATRLISMIEEFLKAGMVPGGVRGVVVTTPVPDGRIRLGAQIVQAIVDKGFVAPEGADKYRNIILCGTKLDKADSEDIESFMNGVDGQPSVRQLFFAKSTHGTGPCVMVSHKDYNPLRKAIKELPAMAIAYQKPKSKVMAEALAEKLGMKPEELQNQMEEMRELVEAQSQQQKDLMYQMHKERQQHREEMKKQDEVIQNILAKAQERHHKMEEAIRQRDAHLEQVRCEQDEERRKEREEQARQIDVFIQRLEEQERRAHTEITRMEEHQRAAEERHRLMVQEMQTQHAREMALARESGCFPASAVLQTPAGPKMVAEIRAGERVLAVDSSGRLRFDDVYFFGHASSTQHAKYVCLHTSSGKVLRASPKHFIALAPSAPWPRWSETEYVYAEAVKVGHHVWVIDTCLGCEAELRRDEVVEVSSCMAKGLFNPYTLTGTVVTGEVVASAHSDWLLDDLCPSGWVGKLPGLYQALFLPGRLLYRAFGSRAADILDVNNPQELCQAALGTSPQAFTFFLASALVPMSVMAGAYLQLA